MSNLTINFLIMFIGSRFTVYISACNTYRISTVRLTLGVDSCTYVSTTGSPPHRYFDTFHIINYSLFHPSHITKRNRTTSLQLAKFKYSIREIVHSFYNQLILHISYLILYVRYYVSGIWNLGSGISGGQFVLMVFSKFKGPKSKEF